MESISLKPMLSVIYVFTNNLLFLAAPSPGKSIAIKYAKLTSI